MKQQDDPGSGAREAALDDVATHGLELPGGLDLGADLLTEVAAELGIDDLSVLQGVLSEVLEDNGFSGVAEKVVLSYEPKDFQRVDIRHVNGENVYELYEPELTKRDSDKLELIEKVFDKFVGMEDAVFAQDRESRMEYLSEKFKEITKLYNLKLAQDERDRILYYIERDFISYGKLDVMMNDKYIEDISCNGHGHPLYVFHREYGSIRTNLSFTETELNAFVLRLSQLCGKHISILNPIVDASLPDGSRINMTLGSEVTKKGSSFTIRKFKKVPISPVELMGFGTADSRLLSYLWLVLDYGRSILVSGGTASGKTTLLNAVCMFIKPQYKIVSIEDTPEINIEHPNWLQSVARSGFGGRSGSGSASGVSGISGISGSHGDIGLFDLLVAALRQRPDYILVGEVRGAEAFTMFQAIAVGHTCLGTIHARNMTELLGRVEAVPMNVPRTLFSNVDIVVFITQIKSGDKTVRRIVEVVEILELEPENKSLITNVVFRWDPKTDTFTMGRSIMFDKIANEFGIPVKVLSDEHKKRCDLLDTLKSRGVSDHVNFTKSIVSYYTGKLGEEGFVPLPGL
ncbi:MAG: type II/IV secretion system ATPase subunit [Candidatus Altiarchaeota archaeon]|nr:type II/IV secretion system ATPase subunit [Candidatus Altiarchaeota archaeon]